MIEIRDAVTHYSDRESFYFHNITFEEGKITSVIGVTVVENQHY